MAVITMKALLESGVHFGHRTNKWDPRMKPYIFTERNGIHIIDLQQTVKLLNQAYNLVRDTVQAGGVVLFVGTKRQAQETIAEEATRCGMPYVTERWLGGMLTNWSTMFQRITQLDHMEKMAETGELARLTKKEGLLIGREAIRLKARLSGIRTMKRLPSLVFVVDVAREAAAVHEANLLDIPVVALVDTNCNPQDIDYVVPSNDDAIRAIKLLVGKMADAVLEGKSMRKDEEAAQEAVDAQPVVVAPSQAGRVVESDDDIEEDVLLGEATLAKLNRAAEAAAAQTVEATPEPAAVEVVEPVVTAEVPVEFAEAPAESVETPSETEETTTKPAEEE